MLKLIVYLNIITNKYYAMSIRVHFIIVAETERVLNTLKYCCRNRKGPGSYVAETKSARNRNKPIKVYDLLLSKLYWELLFQCLGNMR